MGDGLREGDVYRMKSFWNMNYSSLQCYRNIDSKQSMPKLTHCTTAYCVAGNRYWCYRPFSCEYNAMCVSSWRTNSLLTTIIFYLLQKLTIITQSLPDAY